MKRNPKRRSTKMHLKKLVLALKHAYDAFERYLRIAKDSHYLIELLDGLGISTATCLSRAG